MPAARYWRLTRLESYDYGDLVLSEIALYEGVSRVDGSATISTVVPQSSGALSALSDADFGTSVTWPAAALLLPGFAIVWDFGSARDIVKVGLAGPSLLTFAHKAVLQYSSDGASWTNLTRQHFRTKWADPTTFHEFGEYPNVTINDPNFNQVSLLLHFDLDGPLFDSSFNKADATLVGTATVAPSSSLYGDAVLSLPQSGNGVYASVPYSSALDFGAGDFTLEMSLALTAGSPNGGIVWGSNNDAVGQVEIAIGAGGVGASIYRISASSNGTSWNLLNQVSGGGVQSGRQHIALVRFGGSLMFFVNGTRTLNNTTLGAASLVNGAGATTIRTIGGQNTTGIRQTFPGLIDEVRVTKGVARYTADFTPPATRLSDYTDNLDATPIRDETPVPTRIVEYVPPDYGVSLSQPVRASIIEYPVPDFGVSLAASKTLQLDQEDGGRFQIVGTVKEVALPVNTPLARRVALYEERSGRFVRATVSDNAGTYSFTEIRGDRPYTVIAFDHTGTYRAVVADKINAEPMP